ncbi:MAG: 30S ribosomal protein S20 [Burkholderiales bacterium]|jgi:small subunit ribosomal protein S20|nr:30S ribosomal protein S20 [Burkholderiales bacterium]
MANSAQARKRARQAIATKRRNASLKSELRTAVKKVKRAVVAGNKSAALEQYQKSQEVIDRIADKKVVHKNLAARTKSRLSQAVKGMAIA